MFDHPADPRDEAPHAAGPEPLWGESWYFDFATADASLGGYVRLGLYPRLGVAWYWACLVGPDRPLVTVVDHEVAVPAGDSLEVRGDGLWADHTCEEPLERWSLGLESFAVALDHPADAYGPMRGEKVPFGFDLEWETEGAVFRYPPGIDRYEVPCRVHGEIKVGSEVVELDAIGQRDHSWGVRDWWEQGWCWSAFRSHDGTAWHAVVPGVSPFTIGYVQAPGAEPETVVDSAVTATCDAEGIPERAELRVGTTAFTVEPVAWAPVLLTAPDGRLSRFPRGLCRFTAESDPRSGVGWIEFNQPA